MTRQAMTARTASSSGKIHSSRRAKRPGALLDVPGGRRCDHGVLAARRHGRSGWNRRDLQTAREAGTAARDDHLLAGEGAPQLVGRDERGQPVRRHRPGHDA